MTFPFPFLSVGGRKYPEYINQTDKEFLAPSTTFSHTTTHDTSALVVLLHGYDNGASGSPAVTTVSFDGADLVEATSVVSGNSGYDCRSAIYYLLSPPAKSANISVVWNRQIYGSVQAINLRNATALDAVGNDAVVTPLSVNLITSAPSIMFGAGMGIKVGPPTFTWSSGVIETLDATPATNFSYAAGYRQSSIAENYNFQLIPNATLLAGNLACAAFT